MSTLTERDPDLLALAVCDELHIDPATTVAGSIRLELERAGTMRVTYSTTRELTRAEQLRVTAAVASQLEAVRQR